MQQTKRYKLNQIEPQDHFLPQALAENAQKIEDALLAHEEQVDGQLSALDQRVTVLELHHFACGFYTGTGGKAQVISLPFAPKAVIVTNGGMYNSEFGGISVKAGNGELNKIKLLENGFEVNGACSYSSSPFSYMAFA